MNRMSSRVASGVLAVAVVTSIAVPASARSRDEQRNSPQPKRPDVVQMLRQFVVRALGDGLIIPRP